MTEAIQKQQERGSTYGEALSPLWAGLHPISYDENTNILPQLIDIDVFAEQVVNSGRLNGSTAAVLEVIESSRRQWLTKAERRFVIGVEIAVSLATDARAHAAEQTPEVNAALTVVEMIDEPNRSAVLGAVFLAQEQPFRKVLALTEAKYDGQSDVSYVSALFALPSDAAKLRLTFDEIETVSEPSGTP